MSNYWIDEYNKKNLIKFNLLSFEEKEIFKKYSENESIFIPQQDPAILDDITIDNSENVEIIHFSELDKLPEELKKFIVRDKIEAFINSRIKEGTIIKIKERKIEDPEVKISIKTGKANLTKFVIYAAKGSKAKIFIEDKSNKENYSLQSINIIAEEESKIKIVSIQDSNTIKSTNYNIISNGYLELNEFIGNDNKTRERIFVDLYRHAEVKIKQGLIGQKDAYFDIETEIDHMERDTMSNVIYKAAMNDKSKAIYKGVIFQNKNSYNSYAYLSESSLLLSKDAKSISVPSLEIENNELKAYHSASSEPIDKDILFYIMSRGMDEKDSIKMITRGFLSIITNGEEILENELYKKF